jgi:thiol-disulfide isomerase/thioredoxin
MFRRMKRLVWLGLLISAVLLRAADAPVPPLEKQVADIIAGPQVTVVHFWAPWCPNCRAEMQPDGWARFIAANPNVKFVFLNIWHKGQDPQPKLDAAGLGPQANLLLLTHPNPSRLAADKLTSFLGLPVTWIPTTWVYRDGKLRVAFNYGEIRFPVLQQMIDDARDKWEH